MTPTLEAARKRARSSLSQCFRTSTSHSIPSVAYSIDHLKIQPRRPARVSHRQNATTTFVSYSRISFDRETAHEPARSTFLMSPCI